jgi:hypothetical protein
MASTKSTVVGIRLDHERRAWVEAEAARLGVSIRGLFEGMIDEARSGESVGATNVGQGAGSESSRADGGSSGEGGATASDSQDEGAAAARQGVNTDSTSPSGAAAGRTLLPDLGSIAALPGGLLRGACSLTVSVLESSGRCAVRRLGGCVLTRGRSDRSV